MSQKNKKQFGVWMDTHHATDEELAKGWVQFVPTLSCNNAGQIFTDHFADVSKMVEVC